MTNDETSKETVRFAVRTGTLSGKALLYALKAYIRHRKGKSPGHKVGKQKVKDLVGQDQGVSSVEVSGESMKKFERIAKKYGVDYAIVKDKSSDPPRYTCFFKARDLDAITAVVKEYSAEIVKRQKRRERPSLIEQLRKLKEEIAKRPKKERTRHKERAR